jgi:hypothetical protein
MRNKSFWVALGGYLVVLCVVFGNALIPKPGYLLFGDDIHREYYFFRQFLNNAIHSGFIPWWNPYNFAGTPFMADPIVNIFYPPNWLYVLLPLNTAYSWHIAFHVVWAMVGMYVFLGYLGTLGHLSKWLGGLIFGLSGFFAARIWAGHVDVIAAASWMPWVAYASTRVFSWQWTVHGKNELKNILILAIFTLTAQLYAGYQTMAFFTMEAVGVLFVIQVITDRPPVSEIIQRISRIAFVVLCAFGLFCVVLLPQQEFFRESIRTYPFPYSWNSVGALEWRSLVQMLNPFYFGTQLSYHGQPPNYPEQIMFVGVVGLVLALIGQIGLIRHIWAKKRAWTGIGFALVAFIGLWVSLGPNARVDLQYFLWKLIPFYHYLRLPPRHLVLFVFGLAGLSGIGFDFLSKSLKLPKSLRLLMTGVLVVEMVLYARNFIVLKPIPETGYDPVLVRTVTTGIYRVLPNFGVWVPPRDSLPFDSSMSLGYFSATGYNTMILKRYYHFIDTINNASVPSVLEHDVQVPYLDIHSRALDFLNIKYLLVPTKYDPLGGASTDRFTLLRTDAKRDYRLYENITVLPRYFLVTSAKNIADMKSSSDFSTSVYIEKPLNDQSQTNCKTNSAEVTSYTPNAVQLAISSDCDGYLVSSEVNYPGWEARVDGKPAPILEGNGAFRTIAVSKGEHVVTYTFIPRIFVLGGLISVGTLIVILFWMRKSYEKS